VREGSKAFGVLPTSQDIFDGGATHVFNGIKSPPKARHPEDFSFFSISKSTPELLMSGGKIKLPIIFAGLNCYTAATFSSRLALCEPDSTLIKAVIYSSWKVGFKIGLFDRRSWHNWQHGLC